MSGLTKFWPVINNSGQLINQFVALDGSNTPMTGPLLLSGNATLPLQAVTLQQLQFAQLGVTPFGAAHAATTAADGNKALTGAVTADGQAVPNNDNVLLQFQTDPKENGLWKVNTGGAWSRPSNFVNGTDAAGGIVSVVNGPTYQGQIRIQIYDPGIVGTDPLDFQFFSTNTVFADGVTIVDNSNIFSIANDGILDIHVNSAAGIQGTKISPDFGAQTVESTGSSSFANITLTGTGGTGFVNIVPQNTFSVSPVSGVSLFSTLLKKLAVEPEGGFSGLLDMTNLSTVRNFEFPDANGIVALVPSSNTFVGSAGGLLTSFATVDLATMISGILPVANGGTNSSSFTPGSVVFADGIQLTENNNEFFWDNTNFRLGINAGSSPSTALQIGTADATKYLQLDPTTGIISSSSSLTITQIVAEKTFGSGLGAEIAVSSRPSGAMGGFEDLGWYSFFGRDSANNQRRGAYIRGITSGAWTATSLPTHMDFYTTAAASDIPLQRARLFSSGEMYFGSTGLVVNTGTLSVGPLTSAKVGVYIRAQSGQTADLLQLQNNSAVTVMNVDADGDLSAKSLKAAGTAGTGFLELNDQFISVLAPSSAIRVFSNAGNLAVKTSSPTYTFDHSLLSTNRTFQFQDSDYIVANVPTTGIVYSDGSTLSSFATIDLNGQVSGTLPFANGGTGSTSIAAGLVTSNGSALSSTSFPSSGIVTSNGSALSSTTFPSAGLVTSTGSALGSLVRRVHRVTSTQSNSTVTPTALTELTTASLPTGTYRIKGTFVFQSVATGTGIGFRLNAAGATLSEARVKWNIAQAANGVSHDFEYDQLNTSTNLFSASTLVANTDALANCEGFFTVSSAGAVAIEMRSEIGGSAVSIRAGSFILIEQIA